MNESLITAIRGLGIDIAPPNTEGGRYTATVKDRLKLELIFPHIRIVDAVCEALAAPALSSKIPVTAVAGASQHPGWGAVLAYGVARHLTNALSRDVTVIDVYRTGSGTSLTVGPCIKGERVLVVSDVLATGMTVSRLVTKLREQNAHIIGVSFIGDRKDVASVHTFHENCHFLFDIVRTEPKSVIKKEDPKRRETKQKT